MGTIRGDGSSESGREESLDTPVTGGRSGPQSVLTVCPFCASGCGLYLQLNNGRLTGTIPAEHHPISHGRLCSRGWAAHEAPLWGRRLSRPLIRGAAGLEPASWSDAIGVAADCLKQLTEDGQPVGVFGSGRATNEENFLVGQLARCALKTNNVDFSMRARYQAIVSGVSEHSFGVDLTSALDDISRSELIILLEGDVAASHPQVAHAILIGVKGGARLVTIGPRRTQLSRVGWLHLPLLPGDESVLVARLLIAADGDSRSRSGTAGAEQRAGSEGNGRYIMSAAELQRVLDSYSSASRAAVVLASDGAATWWLRAIASGFTKLAQITGHLKRQGSVILPLPYRSNTRGALEMGVTPHCLPGRRSLDDGAMRQRLRQIWRAEPPYEKGLDAEQMLGAVKGLVLLADDPSRTLPLEREGRTRLAGMECLVVLDSYLTTAAEAARVVLPIASAVEADGTVTSMDGRIQRQRGAIRPPGEARPGWWALNELASILGSGRCYSSVEEITRDIAATVPEYGEVMAAAKPEESGVVGMLSLLLGDERTLEADFDQARGPAPGIQAVGVSNAHSEYPFSLVRADSFEWSDDVLVEASPTLSRDRRSMRKLFPRGFLEMSAEDAKELGIREGWTVRVSSRRGETLVPVRLRSDVTRGMMLVPFSFRDHLEPVLGRETVVEVKVERT